MSDSHADLLKQVREKKSTTAEGRVAKALLGDIYKNALRCAVVDEQRLLYEVTPTNVLRAVPDAEVESHIYTINPNLNSRERAEAIKYLKLEVSQTGLIDLAIVAPIAFADEPETLTWNRLAFKRNLLDQVTLDDIPEFKYILSLCDDPTSLVLWIGSILDPGSGRAQYLHLYGGGGNGKSTLFNALTSVLGQRYVLTASAEEFANTHWGDGLEGSRLLIFPDENNPGFFSSGRFKRITGEEYHTVNPKYKSARKIKLTHKTAVFSNNQVEISINAADRRRLLSISMAADPDPNVGYRWWYEGLRSSGAKILTYCYSEYLKAVEATPSIRAYISQEEKVYEAAMDRKYADILDVLADHYTITDDVEDIVTRRDLHDHILEELKERRSKLLMQQIREALLKLGAQVGFAHGHKAVYRRIKRRSTSGFIPLKLSGGA